MVEKKTATRKKSGRKTSSKKAGTSGNRKTTGKSHDNPADDGGNGGRADDSELEGKIILDESLTISSADNFKDRLTEYVGKCRSVEIDGSNVELIDTAALQILTSFIIQLQRESVEIRWVGKSDVLVKTAALLGLTGHLNL